MKPYVPDAAGAVNHFCTCQGLLLDAPSHTATDDRAEHMTLAGRGVYLMLLVLSMRTA